tara:strand:+ start:51 stop:230 length:180 start_codon:yes stop_codon:yes gene_type:complete
MKSKALSRNKSITQIEKNIFHLNKRTIEPQQFLWTKSGEKCYLEFLEKFDIPKEYVWKQ